MNWRTRFENQIEHKNNCWIWKGNARKNLYKRNLPIFFSSQDPTITSALWWAFIYINKQVENKRSAIKINICKNNECVNPHHWDITYKNEFKKYQQCLYCNKYNNKYICLDCEKSLENRKCLRCDRIFKTTKEFRICPGCKLHTTDIIIYNLPQIFIKN